VPIVIQGPRLIFTGLYPTPKTEDETLCSDLESIIGFKVVFNLDSLSSDFKEIEVLGKGNNTSTDYFSKRDLKTLLDKTNTPLERIQILNEKKVLAIVFHRPSDDPTIPQEIIVVRRNNISETNFTVIAICSFSETEAKQGLELLSVFCEKEVPETSGLAADNYSRALPARVRIANQMKPAAIPIAKRNAGTLLGIFRLPERSREGVNIPFLLSEALKQEPVKPDYCSSLWRILDKLDIGKELNYTDLLWLYESREPLSIKDRDLIISYCQKTKTNRSSPVIFSLAQRFDFLVQEDNVLEIAQKAPSDSYSFFSLGVACNVGLRVYLEEKDLIDLAFKGTGGFSEVLQRRIFLDDDTSSGLVMKIVLEALDSKQGINRKVLDFVKLKDPEARRILIGRCKTSQTPLANLIGKKLKVIRKILSFDEIQELDSWSKANGNHTFAKGWISVTPSEASTATVDTSSIRIPGQRGKLAAIVLFRSLAEAKAYRIPTERRTVLITQAKNPKFGAVDSVCFFGQNERLLTLQNVHPLIEWCKENPDHAFAQGIGLNERLLEFLSGTEQTALKTWTEEHKETKFGRSLLDLFENYNFDSQPKIVPKPLAETVATPTPKVLAKPPKPVPKPNRKAVAYAKTIFGNLSKFNPTFAERFEFQDNDVRREIILLAQNEHTVTGEKQAAFYLGKNKRITDSTEEANDLALWAINNPNSDFAKGYGMNSTVLKLVDLNTTEEIISWLQRDNNANTKFGKIVARQLFRVSKTLAIKGKSERAVSIKI